MESTNIAPEVVVKKPHWKTLQKQNKDNDIDIEPVNTALPKGVERVAPSEDSEYNIEVIKDYHGNIDPFYLQKKDPRYEYRFLRADDKNLSMATNNMLFNGGGWQLCDKKHLLRIGVGDRFVSPDGLYRVGDTVLAFIPKELYAEKVKMEQKKADDNMNAIDRRLEHGEHVPGIHKTFQGIQSKESLRGNWKD